MKTKLLSMMFLSSVLSANPPTEEIINLPQSQEAQQTTAPMQNPMQTQNLTQNPTQPTPQAHSNNAILPTPLQQAQPQPQTQQPMHNMPYPNNMGGGYGGASLQNIFAKVQQMYPGSFVTDVDYKGFGYEIEINDSLELLFDMNGNLLWQKWD